MPEKGFYENLPFHGIHSANKNVSRFRFFKIQLRHNNLARALKQSKTKDFFEKPNIYQFAKV